MKQFLIAMLMMVLYAVLAGIGFLVTFIATYLMVRHLIPVHQGVGPGGGARQRSWQALIALLVGGGTYTVVIGWLAWRSHKRRRLVKPNDTLKSK